MFYTLIALDFVAIIAWYMAWIAIMAMGAMYAQNSGAALLPGIFDPSRFFYYHIVPLGALAAIRAAFVHRKAGLPYRACIFAAAPISLGIIAAAGLAIKMS